MYRKHPTCINPQNTKSVGPDDILEQNRFHSGRTGCSHLISSLLNQTGTDGIDPNGPHFRCRGPDKGINRSIHCRKRRSACDWLLREKS